MADRLRQNADDMDLEDQDLEEIPGAVADDDEEDLELEDEE
jgi:hypothetical protein